MRSGENGDERREPGMPGDKADGNTTPGGAGGVTVCGGVTEENTRGGSGGSGGGDGALGCGTYEESATAGLAPPALGSCAGGGSGRRLQLRQSDRLRRRARWRTGNSCAVDAAHPTASPPQAPDVRGSFAEGGGFVSRGRQPRVAAADLGHRRLRRWRRRFGLRRSPAGERPAAAAAAAASGGCGGTGGSGGQAGGSSFALLGVSLQRPRRGRADSTVGAGGDAGAGADGGAGGAGGPGGPGGDGGYDGGTGGVGQNGGSGGPGSGGAGGSSVAAFLCESSVSGLQVDWLYVGDAGVGGSAPADGFGGPDGISQLLIMGCEL